MYANPNEDIVKFDKKLTQLSKNEWFQLHKNGVVIFVDKSINIHAPVTGSQLNTGDEAQLTQTNQSGVSEDVFVAFINEIKKLPDGREKEDALADVQSLQDAAKKGNWERAKGVFKLFSETLRTSAAGVTVAKAIGLIPPLP